MAKTILTVIIVVVVLGGIVILLNNVKISPPAASQSPTVSVVPTSTPEETVGNIHVFSPKPGDEIGLPVIIQGEARTFERHFSYRVINAKGTVLVEGAAMSSGKVDIGQFDPFTVSVNYPDPKTASGSIEVFEYSARDGSEINNVIVPVMFEKNPAAVSVKLYFVGLTTPLTRRIAKSDTPIRAALDELFKGVYKTENPTGAITSSIPAGTVINSVSLKSGVLTIDLSATMNAAAQTQITKTAQQFASVTSVVFTTNGKAN